MEIDLSEGCRVSQHGVVKCYAHNVYFHDHAPDPDKASLSFDLVIASRRDWEEREKCNKISLFFDSKSKFEEWATSVRDALAEANAKFQVQYKADVERLRLEREADETAS